LLPAIRALGQDPLMGSRTARPEYSREQPDKQEGRLEGSKPLRSVDNDKLAFGITIAIYSIKSITYMHVGISA